MFGNTCEDRDPRKLCGSERIPIWIRITALNVDTLPFRYRKIVDNYGTVKISIFLMTFPLTDSKLDSLVASRQAELSTVMATYSTVSTRLQR